MGSVNKIFICVWIKSYVAVHSFPSAVSIQCRCRGISTTFGAFWCCIERWFVANFNNIILVGAQEPENMLATISWLCYTMLWKPHEALKPVALGVCCKINKQRNVIIIAAVRNCELTIF